MLSKYYLQPTFKRNITLQLGGPTPVASGPQSLPSPRERGENVSESPRGGDHRNEQRADGQEGLNVEEGFDKQISQSASGQGPDESNTEEGDTSDGLGERRQSNEEEDQGQMSQGHGGRGRGRGRRGRGPERTWW